MRYGRLGRFVGWHYGFLFAFFCLVSSSAFSAYSYTMQVNKKDIASYTNIGPVSSAQEACDAWLATQSDWEFRRMIATFSGPSTPSSGDLCVGWIPDEERTISYRLLQVSGEPDVDCSGSGGVVIQRWTEASLGSEINVDGCGYRSSGVGLCVPHLEGFNCYSDYTGTGNPYSGSSGDPSVPGGSEPPCISGDSGNRVCGNPQKMNCGKFNGTSYCVSPNDVPGCKQSAGGLSVICAMESDGSAPPGAPTTDFGSPISADQTWDHTDQGENLHHMGGWNQGGSDGDGSGDGSGGGDPGTPVGGSSIEGDNNGDGECQGGEDCAGGGPELGENPGLPTSDVTTVDWSSGFASSATCPAPETISIPFVSGASFQISYQPLCDFALMINPLVLAAAYLSAAFVMLRGLS